MDKEDEDVAYGPNAEGELHEGCRKCNVNFGSATELKLHFSSIHNRQTFECFVCNKLFLPKFAFLAHINRYHEDCDKSYPCQFCDKSYTNQAALDQHISGCHNNSLLSGPYDTPAPLTCPICGKFFQQKFSLNRHIRLIHENPNPPKVVDDGKHPFKCLTCGKSYKSQSGLTMHSKLKHQHTQYKCELCSKFFSRASTVARHVDTIHNNMLTMYPCKWCGKEFRSRGGHDMHVTAEHKAIRYDCEICSKQFKRKCSLSRHLQGVHDLDNNRSSQQRLQPSQQRLQPHPQPQHPQQPHQQPQHHPQQHPQQQPHQQPQQHHPTTNNPTNATANATNNMVNDTSHNNMQHIVPQIKME